MLKKYLLFFVCFFMLSPLSLALADQMYVINGGGCGGGCINPGVLHTYNPATDTFTSLGSPTGIPMVGLDYNQDTGVLYGLSRNTSCGPDNDCQILYTINPDTGAEINEIGPIVDGSANVTYIYDIAIQPSTGIIYGVDGDTLYRIDPATGAVLSSFDFADSAEADRYEIAFAPDGTLYVTKYLYIDEEGPDDGSYTYLEIIDPDDGTVISTSPVVNYNPDDLSDFWSMGLGVNSSGTVFASRYDEYNANGSIGQIYTVSMSGSTSLYANLDDNGIQDIAFRWDFNAGAVPTVNEWGMIIMSLILAGSAFWMIRHRQMS